MVKTPFIRDFTIRFRDHFQHRDSAFDEHVTLWLAFNWHSVVVATAPLIERQPQSHILIEGEVAVLEVVAKSNGEITYEWGFRSGMIPGARSASLLLGPASANVAGNYEAFVRDR